MRENRLYGSVGGWGLIAPRLPNPVLVKRLSSAVLQVALVTRLAC